MDWRLTDAELARDNLYEMSVKRGPAWPAFEGSSECDAAVVGAGLAGLTAALELAQRGFKVTLLDAGQVSGGASGRNGGQVLPGLACDMSTIESQLGADDARIIWRACAAAVDRLRERCATHGIDAEWQQGQLTVAVGQRKAARLVRDVQRLQDRYGHPLTMIPKDEMPAWIASPRYHAACYDTQAGHLHPLKLGLGLARAAAGAGVADARTQPGVAAGAWRADTAAHGDRHAQRPACRAGRQRGTWGALAPEVSARIMPVGTYVGATTRLDAALLKSLIPSRAAVCDTGRRARLFPSQRRRPPDLRRQGELQHRDAARAGSSLHRRMSAVFPQLRHVRFDHLWGGFVDITANRAPDFGQLGRERGASIYYLQGFSGHGVALTGLAGELVARALAGDSQGWDRFARLRHHPFPGGDLWRTPLAGAGHGLASIRPTCSRAFQGCPG